MKKRNTGLIRGVAATMSIAISTLSVPMVSLAATVPDEEIDTNYHIYVAGRPVVKSNCKDVLGDGTVSYDPENQTLNFKDAKITSGYTENGQTYGIYALDSFNITGNVSISGVDNGIVTKEHWDTSIQIVDGADLDIECKYEGLYADSVTIADSTVKINAVGGNESTYEIAIGGNEAVNINNSMIDVTATSDDLEGNSPIGIAGPTSVGGGSIVNVTTINCGFWGEAVQINDANVTVDAPIGIQSTNILIDDDAAVVDITSEISADGYRATGLFGVYKVDIEAGTVTIRTNGIGIIAMDAAINGENTYVYVNSAQGAFGIDIEFKIGDGIEVLYPEDAVLNEYGVFDVSEELAKEVLISHPLSLKKVEAADPTTEKDGNIEYYECEECGRLFKDDKGLQLISDKTDVIIPKLIPEPTAIATPTAVPTAVATPTTAPAATPTTAPAATPTTAPVATPTTEPAATPTTEPSAEPTVSAIPTATPVAEPTEEPADETDPKAQIREFVDRIYKFVLGREPEEEGAKFWADELGNFNRSGAEVAQGFIFSEEFINRKTTDNEFVEILYNTFFGREADEDGLKYWLEQLSSGAMDRVTVANGFIFSQEWANTCATYGIRSGGDLKADIKIEPTELTYAFVERMYTTALGRESDEEGKAYWAEQLSNFAITGEQVGAFFFLSEEMESFKLDDKAYLDRLYKTFMDRDADPDGATYWLGVMASGTPRADVVLGFTRSPEFTAKCVDARILPY